MTDPRRMARDVPPTELDLVAEITEQDKIEDEAFWRQHGSPLTQAMLNAPTDPRG